MSELEKKQVPIGRIFVETFPNQLPKVNISGEVTTRDIQSILIAIRRAWAAHLDKIGEANKARVAEKNRLEEQKRVEEEKKVEGKVNP